MVTRKDIAAKAGVSVSVVSRALNNSGYVEAEKKERILKIAKELGYSPNPVAMSLATRRTKQILFYCKDLKNSFNIETYQGMMQAAQERGYMVVINGAIDFHQIKNLMVDGLIFPNETLTNIYLKEIGKNYYLPAVSLAYGNAIKGEFEKSVPIVECDLWKGAEELLQYLWMHGHRKIAMLTPYSWSNEESRIVAWKQFTKCELGSRQKEYYLGIASDEYADNSKVREFPEEKASDNMSVAESFFEKGEVAAEIFAEKKLDATAVVCFNDEMALGYYKRITKLGYRVPEDISLVSFDGVYCRRYMDKNLTSLDLQPKKMGSKSVDVLLDLIDGKRIKYTTHIPTKFIEGETVRMLNG